MRKNKSNPRLISTFNSNCSPVARKIVFKTEVDLQDIRFLLIIPPLLPSSFWAFLSLLPVSAVFPVLPRQLFGRAPHGIAPGSVNHWCACVDETTCFYVNPTLTCLCKHGISFLPFHTHILVIKVLLFILVILRIKMHTEMFRCFIINNIHGKIT